MTLVAACIQFFSTIDDSDWLERPRLAPFLPVDPDTGRPDDRNVQDFIAMLKELQSRNNEACRALGKAPAGSKDTLFDQLLWAMERVAKQQYMLTNPEVNKGASAADVQFWQQRIGGVAADPQFYTTEAGTGFKKSLNFFQGHPVVIQFKKFLTDQLVSNRQGDSDAATAQTMDLVAQVTQPHQVAQKRSQANRNLAIGTRGGKQINQHDPMAVMACERDRWPRCLSLTRQQPFIEICIYIWRSRPSSILLCRPCLWLHICTHFLMASPIASSGPTL